MKILFVVLVFLIFCSMALSTYAQELMEEGTDDSNYRESQEANKEISHL